MTEHSWDISFNVTRTYSVRMTEAELVALMVKHNDTVPPADITEGYYDTVIEAWTAEVCNELSVAALVDMAARPDAEIEEEDADINDFDISDDTSGEEDAAWRPNPFITWSAGQVPPRTAQVTRALAGVTMTLAEAFSSREDSVAPDAGEWWRRQ